MSEEWTEWRQVSEGYSARARAVYFEGEVIGAHVELRDDNCVNGDVDFKGHIRFDGCANLEAIDCIHLCGSSGIDDLAKALRGMYKLAAEVADIEGEP